MSMGDAAKRGKMMDVPRFLSRDVIFHILTWLPADFLRNSARHVCKLWSDIILRDPSFTRTHLTRSPVNAVLVGATGSAGGTGARFLEITAEGKPIWKTMEPDPIGRVLSICDGCVPVLQSQTVVSWVGCPIGTLLPLCRKSHHHGSHETS